MGLNGDQQVVGSLSWEFGTRKPPDLPMTGCWWHTEHWSPLNLAPRPDESVKVARFGSSPVSELSITSLHVSQADSS
jgi:hypothetical protein